jgi:ABC-type amino acid transport substrate-binding protein
MLENIIQFLRGLPAPGPAVGTVLEITAKYVDKKTIGTILVCLSLGVGITLVVVYSHRFRLTAFGYATVDDLQAQLNQQKVALDEGWHAKYDPVARIAEAAKAAQTDPFPVSPSDQAVIDHEGRIRFVWNYAEKANSSYSITLVPASRPGKPQDVPIFLSNETEIRPAMSGYLSLSELGLPFGDYLWTINDAGYGTNGRIFRRMFVFPSSLAKIQAKGELVAGTSLLPDGTFLKRDGPKLVGFEEKLLEQIADSLRSAGGRPTVSFNPMEWKFLLPRLHDELVDVVVSSMTRTKWREKDENISFSDGYFTTHQRFLRRQGDTFCLNGRIVGVIGGTPMTTNEIAAHLLAPVYRFNPQIHSYRNSFDLFRALEIGDIDFALGDDVIVRSNYSADDQNVEFFGGDLDSILRPLGFYNDLELHIGYPAEEYAVAVPKEEHELLNRINTVIQTLKKNGTLQNMQSELQLNRLSKTSKTPLC